MTAAACVIREAVRADCPAIAKVKHEVWNTTYRGIYSDERIDGFDFERNRLNFEGMADDPKVTLFVAAEGDKIVGYASCGKPYRSFGDYKQEIGLLYILKEYQRRGIGRRLFRAAEAEIAKTGADRFFVSVNKYNVSALEFYTAMGGSVVHVDGDKPDKRDAQVKLRYVIKEV
jgi:ribosomal protein S18 acetylase RimI-like enzyme